ncbi:hypothetical protein ACMUMS_17880 [Acinetobacter courvalinii]|uniref:hypothetical protein n=1 Tax=Acinetobacter courvalinii TaxID=280147 RepID=UPI003A86278D
MSDLARRRSSMVLCAIEESLGKFIRDQGAIELINEKNLMKSLKEKAEIIEHMIETL